MVEIVYQEFPKEQKLRLTAHGHAGYATKGQDIVCAAVSALMQTLAYSTDSETGGMRGDCVPELIVQADAAEENAAKFELVVDGLYLLAQQYPENVRLINLCENGADNVDLQLFAEGAAAAGDGAGAAEGEAAPAVQAPALRPAQERLAKRSHAGHAAKAAGPGKAQGGDETLSPLPSADGGASRSSPEEGAKNQGSADESQSEGGTGEEKQNTEEQAPLTAQQRRSAFAQAMQQYPEEFEEAMQRAAQMAVQNIRQNPQLNELGQALADAYGVDMSDMAGLIDAVKNGRVKNDEYYETMAQQRGISVKTARELDRMEGELQRANAEKQRAQQMRLAAEHQQRAAAVRAQWEAEAAKLKNSYPDFELDEVLNNPAVADMIRRGVGLEAAYRAAYFDRIVENRTALTAKQVEQGVTARIQQRSSRPAENGAHPGGAAEMKVDVAHMTKQQREELARRARRGERIVL